jgi:hypothetical protein
MDEVDLIILAATPFLGDMAEVSTRRSLPQCIREHIARDGANVSIWQ